ncbi:Putative oxidoreductase MhqP [Corynebacterium urogenitale]|uniref:Oxidoreductase MhqP n=1 Tax=Corynebacterium urogenitale TaxID=2487892 RepID=A0A5J6Z386_9CORY|nr:DoxX family protein [Corynebacterium urogenitale]QFQ01486.1 Putative oxidoreductase MhqP [Corynebacterium urogenitale]
MNIIRCLFLLIARVILGVVLIAHGWQKYNDWTVEGTGQNFEQMGVPSPDLSAQIVTYFEITGGVLLILGLLVRLVGPLLFVAMAGAAWFAHRDNGIFVADGGWELVAVIGAAGLALSAAGAGRISLDYLLATPFRRRKEAKAAERDEKLRQEGAANAQVDGAQYADAQHSSAQVGGGYAGAQTGGAGYAGTQADAGYAGAQTGASSYAGTQAGAGQAGAPADALSAGQYGGVDAKRDFADERTEQINLGEARGAQNSGNGQQFGSQQGAQGQQAKQMPGDIDGDAPTTQWPGAK